MTNREIYEIALSQSAAEAGCRPEDFLSGKNIAVVSRAVPSARKYLELPLDLNFITYGNNIVASALPAYIDIAREYTEKFAPWHCFETPGIYALNDELFKYGLRVHFMAEYFLPDTNFLAPNECGYEMRILEQADFKELYLPKWSNALCEKRRELDVLGVGAYEKGELIGLAACSADCEKMYQIGIDVLPEKRRQGIAAALTGRLTREILDRGKVPFYCCAWANIGSARNAIRCGFRPAWAELTVKKINKGA